MRAAHFILYVRDQARSARFWTHVLGLEPRLDVPGMTEFELTQGCVLGLMPEPSIAKLLPDLRPSPVGAEAARAELYLVVDDPAGHHGRALEAGALEQSPLQLRSWGHAAAYSTDLDGHVLAFATDSTD